MQIDGDSYLKVWRAPASQAGYAGVGFDAALERHQTTARHRIDRFGADLQRLGRYIGAAIYIVSAGTPLGGAGTAWLNGEAVLAAALAGATPPLVLFAHRVVRPMLVRAALRWIARRAFRRMNAGTPRDWRSRLA